MSDRCAPIVCLIPGSRTNRAEALSIVSDEGHYVLFSRYGATTHASHSVPPNGCCIRYFLSVALQPHERPPREHNAGALLIQYVPSRGGAILGSVSIWTLAVIFSIIAIFGLAKLSAQPIRIAQTGEVFTPFGTDI